jgi:hypothetical protein
LLFAGEGDGFAGCVGVCWRVDLLADAALEAFAGAVGLVNDRTLLEADAAVGEPALAVRVCVGDAGAGVGVLLAASCDFLSSSHSFASIAGFLALNSRIFLNISRISASSSFAAGPLDSPDASLCNAVAAFLLCVSPPLFDLPLPFAQLALPRISSFSARPTELFAGVLLDCRRLEKDPLLSVMVLRRHFAAGSAAHSLSVEIAGYSNSAKPAVDDHVVMPAQRVKGYCILEEDSAAGYSTSCLLRLRSRVHSDMSSGRHPKSPSSSVFARAH